MTAITQISLSISIYHLLSTALILIFLEGIWALVVKVTYCLIFNPKIPHKPNNPFNKSSVLHFFTQFSPKFLVS